MVREKRVWGFVLSSMLCAGCYATIAQVLLVREFLVVFFGNELCLGIILGVWFLGIAFGAAAGGKIVVKLNSYLPAFVLVLLSMCLILPLDVIIIRVLRYILSVPPGQYIPILPLLSSSVIIIVPFSFTIGMLFPLACKVIRGVTRDSASDIGIAYILESIGSLIGGVMFTFVLVSRFQPLVILTFFQIIIFINVFLMIFFLDKGFLRRGKLAVCILFLIVILSLLLSNVANRVDEFFVNVRWNSLNPGIGLLESADSRYENIVIGEQEGQYSVFGNGQYNFAFPNDYEDSQIAHLVMTQHPAPKRVLLIGGGMGGLIRELLKHPVEELHYVELDPALISLVKKYLPPDDMKALSDKRVKVFHDDGRSYVKRVRNEVSYDLVFVNVPDPSTAYLNRFYTLQFFREIDNILEKDGIFAIGLSSAINYMGEEIGNYTGSVYQTISSVFPHVIVSPGHTGYYFAGNTSNMATFDIQTLSKRYVERSIESDYFSEHIFYTLLPPDRVKYVEDEIKGRKGLKINTDSKPVTYFFSLVLWDNFSGSQLHNVLQWMEKTSLMTFLVPILLFLIIRIVYVLIFKRSRAVQLKANCIIAIATTGFAGMALEIILIYAFQNIYGYVYEKIGLIIAFFMFGLVVGSGLSNKMILRNVKREHDWMKILMLLETAIIIYAGIMPFILGQLSLRFFGSEYIFMILVIITGILTGLEFPIAGKLYLQNKGDSGVTAGKIDSADHAGAFAGAILTGVLFVPVFGIAGSCVIMATLNLVSLSLLAFLNFRKSN